MSLLTNGNTGEKCVRSGLYFCTLHPTSLVHMSQGLRFPECDHSDDGKGHHAKWAFVPVEENNINLT